jgi:ankyrin repeat protein
MGTPLHIAASYGHLACVRTLVKAGAGVKAKDAEGRSPLDYARRYRRGAVVRYLRELESA